MTAEVRERAARPRDAAFYKKELTSWDVVQKLFKREMDEYDKAQQAEKGVKHVIKYRASHAREWFNGMTPSQKEEVENARAKWEKEGAPEESQAL